MHLVGWSAEPESNPLPENTTKNRSENFAEGVFLAGFTPPKNTPFFTLRWKENKKMQAPYGIGSAENLEGILACNIPK